MSPRASEGLDAAAQLIEDRLRRLDPAELGVHEIAVGYHGLAHPLYGVFELGLQLSPYRLAQPFAKGVRLLPELRAGLASRPGRQLEARHQQSQRRPCDVQRLGLYKLGGRFLEAQGAGLRRRCPDGGLPQGFHQPLRLVPVVVVLYGSGGGVADGPEQVFTADVEVVGDLAREASREVRLAVELHIVGMVRHCFTLR